MEMKDSSYVTKEWAYCWNTNEFYVDSLLSEPLVLLHNLKTNIKTPSEAVFVQLPGMQRRNENLSKTQRYFLYTAVQPG